MFPDALFEEYKPLPNIMICLNFPGEDGEFFDAVFQETGRQNNRMSIDRRYFLPLANNASILGVRNIMLSGEDPCQYPDLDYALKCFSGRVENLCLVVRPAQSLGMDSSLVPLLQEIVYRIPPDFREGQEGYFGKMESLKNEISDLRKINRDIKVQAMLYLSGGNLSRLDQVIDLIERCGFDRLHFFPANLYLAPGKGRSAEPNEPGLLPSGEEITNLERTFWDLLEESCFESRLFDLNICRRQLERVLEYFKCALGMGGFPPPYCRAHRIACFIQPGGVVRCCPYQKAIGNLAEKSLIRIRESEELRLFQADINMARDPMCPVCPGVYPHLLWKSR
jgi:hypothetical protein